MQTVGSSDYFHQSANLHILHTPMIVLNRIWDKRILWSGWLPHAGSQVNDLSCHVLILLHYVITIHQRYRRQRWMSCT